MNVNWSEKEIELLARAELTDKEVADILGRSLESVKKKRQRTGFVKVRGRKGTIHSKEADSSPDMPNEEVPPLSV